MDTILIFLGILAFLVVAHELGHFTVAKLSGITVLEFGIGLPPKAFSFQRGETTYSVNWLPIGGFVRMLGEEDPTSPGSFAGKGPFTRLAVLAAGPAVNAVLPILLLAVALTIPRDIVVTDVTVTSVAEGSPAAAAGVLQGDVIREIDGRVMDNSADLFGAVQRRLGADSEWVVQRGGERVTLHVDEVRVAPPEGEGATGITIRDGRVAVASVALGSAADRVGLESGDLFLSVGSRSVLTEEAPAEAVALAIEEQPGARIPIVVGRGDGIVELAAQPNLGALDGLRLDVRPTESRSEPFWKAVPGAFGQMRDILVAFRNEISRWVSGTRPSLSGPVGIARVTGQVADAGLSPLITWSALLSINLAIINFLPVPALDGGRITFVLLELARGGRRIAPDKERMVHFVGYVMLLGAILLITANDLQRLIQGASPFG